jgi:hypothetical protein
MSIQNFKTTKVSILRLPFGSPEKKCHLDVGLVESHQIYYREENGASSQRLWAYKAYA